MKDDLTLIAVVLDRSGSMSKIQSDMEGGLNTFIKGQAAEPGECRLTVAQFDDNYEVLSDYIDIHAAPHFPLIPRGSTALLDAIGKTVTTVGEKLASLSEDERPSKVMVVVITDGFENASREWKHDKVMELIKKQTDDYKWQFIYLGADQDAIAVGQSMGFASNSSMTYDSSYRGAPEAVFASVASAATSYRRDAYQGFTQADRAAAVGEDDDEDAV